MRLPKTDSILPEPRAKIRQTITTASSHESWNEGQRRAACETFAWKQAFNRTTMAVASACYGTERGELQTPNADRWDIMNP